MPEKSLDDAPSTNPCGIVGSLPGRLLACTYGMQPALQFCRMIEPRSKAAVYELGHTAPGICCSCSRRVLALPRRPRMSPITVSIGGIADERKTVSIGGVVST